MSEQKHTEFLYIYIHVRTAISFHSLQNLKEKTWFSSDNGSQVKHATAAPTFPGSSRGHIPSSLVKN